MVDIEKKILESANVKTVDGLTKVIEKIDKEIKKVEALEKELHLQYIQLQATVRGARIVGGEVYNELQDDIIQTWALRMKLFALKEKYEAQRYQLQILRSR